VADSGAAGGGQGAGPEEDEEDGAEAFAHLHPAGAAPQRLDLALAGALAGRLSRARIQALIAAGHVRVNGQAADAARLMLRPRDTVEVTVPEPEPAHPQPQPMDLVILHEDADVIVIDKPAGLTVHPGAGTPDGTLVNALIAHCGDSLSGIGGVRRPGIVHRLDKDTSGVMVVAKNDKAHAALSAQFADHGRTGVLDRRYLALVWGAPPRPAGEIDAPLGRSSTDRTKRAVVPLSHPDARDAVTHYAVLRRFGPQANPVAALVECRLETGRTHQIRVHMAHLGCPLVADPLYGKGFATRVSRLEPDARAAVEALGRQALHAAKLAFAHPRTGRLMAFETSPPGDMRAVLDTLSPLTTA
jgi:23S rRNA pseudouridine1911/1915/1917 synthase